MKQQAANQGQQPPAPAQTPGGNIAQYLSKNIKAMGSVLPKHMTPERMARIALSEIRKNPQLLQCNVESLGAAVMQAATLGLEPTTLGHCYFIPFNRKEGNTWVKDVQFIIGYKGYIDLAHRSGDLKTIKSFAVHENDHFVYQYGIEEKLEHIPADDNRGQIVKYYAYAILKDGGTNFIVMSREAILEHAFKHSKQVKDGKLTGTWQKHFDSMAKKTVIKELIKYMPMSVEYQEQVNSDEKIIKDITPDKDNIFDMEFAEIEEEPPAEAQTIITDQAANERELASASPEDLADMQKDLEEARKIQAELDKKKNK